MLHTFYPTVRISLLCNTRKESLTMNNKFLKANFFRHLSTGTWYYIRYVVLYFYDPSG